MDAIVIKEPLVMDAVMKGHGRFMAAGLSSSALTALNMAALARLEKTGLPRRKHEMFTYADLTPLAFDTRNFALDTPHTEIDVTPFILAGCERSRIVLVNGVFTPDLSDISAVGSSVAVKRMVDGGGWEKEAGRLFESLEMENDPYAVMNMAFMRDLTQIDIAPGEALAAPLQIIYVSISSDGAFAIFPRISIRAGALSKSEIITTKATLSSGIFSSSVEEITAGEGASLRVSAIQAARGDYAGMTKTKIALAAKSNISHITVSTGGRILRNCVEARLAGTEAVFNSYGLSVLKGSEQAHFYLRVSHEAEDTESFQHFKNIVKDKSRASVDTTVIAQKGAVRAQSRQLVNNMILSGAALAAVKPNLMIFTDDVKCSHGATIGRLNNDQLFYIRARGVPEKEAKRALTMGFAGEIVDKIAVPSAALAARGAVMEKLEE